jgi:hypothetical protein
VFGYVALGVSIINTLMDHLQRDIHPYDPGVVLANEALTFVGVITIIVAYCLKNLETRLPPEQKDDKS